MKNFHKKITVLMLLTVISGISANFTLFSINIIYSSTEEILDNDSVVNPLLSGSEDDYFLEWNVSIRHTYNMWAGSIAFDSDDNVYLVGSKDITGADNHDVILAKYNSTGSELWVKTWGGSNDDRGNDILIDSSDNIYVSGSTKSRGNINGDLLIIKYNTAGEEQWNKTWGGSNFDSGDVIVMDSSNNFYITGMTENFGDVNGDLILVKFDNSFNEIWNKTWGGGETDWVSDLGISSDGSIYITGHSDSIDPSPGYSDVYLLKYNSSGDLQWEEYWTGSDSQRGRGLAFDSSNNIYVVGYTFGHPTGSGKGFVLKYNSSGDFQWEDLWGQDVGYGDGFYCITSTSDDELYVAGDTITHATAGFTDSIFFNYDLSGNQIYYKTWGMIDKDVAADIQLDSKNNIYVYALTRNVSTLLWDIALLKYEKLSSVIDIITPENKTYTGAMSGYFPASVGFENETNGSDPEGWILEENGGDAQVVEEIDSHKKVLEINDVDINNPVDIRYRFADQASGTVEYWWRISETDKGHSIYIGDNDMPGDPWFNSITLSLEPDGTISYYNGSWQVIQPYNANQWYHVKIEFDCATDWHLWIDNVSMDGGAGFSYRGSVSDMDELGFGTYTPSSNYYCYLDALGYSWDSNYIVGDNLNEGLLLSFDNNTNFDWMGYSLDGGLNKTILGNFTIPIPSDGLHTIQVFGIDNMGTNYESGVQQFTVDRTPPQISITYPTVAQEFSDAPAYILSIIEENVEAIWYTLNGGTIHPIASESGTIDSSAWNALANGPVTIRFYVRDVADREAFDEVIIVKVASAVPTPSGIPGYNLIALLGVCSVITLILLKRIRGRAQR